MRNATTDSPMRVVERLRRFSSYTDVAHARFEEQSYLESPDGRILVTVVEPTGPKQPVAFLLCHSFAWEQFELFALELRFARAAAAAGYTAVCFQARGYGDSEGSFEDVTPSGQATDAVRVAERVLDRAGIDAIVPVGARFGAYIAMHVAHELAAPGAALWNPSLTPVRYLDGLLKAFVRARVMSGSDRSGAEIDTDGLRERLLAGGQVDLFGYPVTSRCYVDAQRLPDALQFADPLPPRVHLIAINPRVRRDVGRMRDALEDRGVSPTLWEADAPGHREFGLGVPIGGHLATHARLFDQIGASTLEWIRGAR